jgi:hypothetical protein
MRMWSLLLVLPALTFAPHVANSSVKNSVVGNAIWGAQVGKAKRGVQVAEDCSACPGKRCPKSCREGPKRGEPERRTVGDKAPRKDEPTPPDGQDGPRKGTSQQDKKNLR